ncbi:MAG: tetratricopeptide repeat protein [Nitrospirae bacterium]|nr:tetratricopeptide repeat protein [Nitrospirota bacterium]MBF0553731.1 tetratricopeptide repeat protein [Nitrospirota bacterium]
MNSSKKFMKNMYKSIDGEIEKCTKEIEHNPENFEALNSRGMYYNAKKDDKAIMDFEKAIKINPNFADVYNNLGGVYVKKGDNDKALSYFNQAIRLDPKFGAALLNRAYLLCRKGDYVQSIDDYTEVIKLITTKIDDDSISEYEKIVEINPMYREAHFNRGVAYFYMENYDSAIEDFSVNIKRDGTDIVAYEARAMAHIKKGAHNLAIDDFTEMIELDPDHAHDEFYYKRGKEYAIIGAHNLAHADFTKAAQLGHIKAQSYLKGKGLKWKKVVVS